MTELFLKIKRRLFPSKEQSAINRLRKRPRYEQGEFTIYGKKVYFPDSRSFLFSYNEIFKEQIYNFDSENKSPIIIDCGANIGLAILFMKYKYPDSKIVAFEPEKNIFKYLTKNIYNNNFSNVELINKAVWKENCLLKFENEGSDSSRIIGIEGIENVKSHYEVEAVKLSDYIESQVELLKIDIEGAEVEVLKEIEHKLQFINRIFIEYHSPNEEGQRLQDILAILSRNGFNYYIDSSFKVNNSPYIEKKQYMGFKFFLNIFAQKKYNI
jgi:FkbM family methyltransferase